MKVLMLTTSYPSEGNSRGIFIQHLVENLEKIGVKIDVINLTKYKVLTAGAGIFPNLNKSWRAKFQFHFYILHLYFLIIKNARKYDLIHANWNLTGLLALLSKLFHIKKILLTERSSQVMYTKNKLMKFILKYVYSHVDKLVLISNSSRKLLIKNYGNINSIVIQNGVDKPKYIFNSKLNIKKKLGFSINTKIILFVGRLTGVKSIDSLILGFNKFKHKKKVLIIIGDGEEENKLKELTNSLGLKKNVVFFGDMKYDEVYRYMTIADVLVLPSLMETGGNVILEAIMFGLPIIATRVGWADDFLVDGFNGYFINKKDENDIGEKLNKIFLDDKSLIKMKRNTKIIQKKLISWEQCAILYEKEYKKLIYGESYEK